MFSLRFAFKNIVSRKSSLVIILFIAFSIAILIMANAVFDSTGNGIEQTFSASFTGDVVIRPKTDFPMSLFGDETPVTGELSDLPRLVPYKNILDFVKSQPELKTCTSQLTGQAGIQFENVRQPVVLFGIDAKSYLDIMSGIEITEGDISSLPEKYVLISESIRSKLESSGKKLNLGDEVKFISSNGSSYSLRVAHVGAFYKYKIQNDLQNNIVLISSQLVRSLLGIESMSTEVTVEKDKSNLIDSFDDVESLFSDDALFGDSEDFESENFAEENSKIAEVESGAESVQASQIEENSSEDTIWNYIICKLNDGENPSKFVRKLNKYFSKNEFKSVAVIWRAAAGMSAQYIYWMRLIFNIGLLLLIGTGFIVVNNTLVIAAMDRTTETGALRAIGASRKFIAVEYLIETLILTTTAAVVGIILGFVGNQLLVNMHITFSNAYLIQLFGGTSLSPEISGANIFMGFLLSFALAIIGWLYPVHIALEVSPVEAMAHI